MSNRTDLPRITPDKAPTLFNREAGGWAYLGGTVAAVATVPYVLKESFKAVRRGETRIKNQLPVLGTVFGAQIIGGLYGAMKGKARQEREMVEGRVVKDPTIWNSGFFGGAMLGGVAILPLTLLLNAGKISPLMYNLISIPIGLGACIKGMSNRKQDMQHDFERSTALRQQEIDVAKMRLETLESTIAHSGSYKDSVSSEEAALLAAKQDTKTAHADKLTDAQALETQRA